MKFKTADGIEFYVVPDGARCTYTRKHPDNMDECPIRAGEPDDDTCCPELCGYYYEYDGYENKRSNANKNMKI